VLTIGVLLLSIGTIITVVAITKTEVKQFFVAQLDNEYVVFTSNILDREKRLLTQLEVFTYGRTFQQLFNDNDKNGIKSMLGSEKYAAQISSVSLVSEKGDIMYVSSGSELHEDLLNNSIFKTALNEDVSEGIAVVGNGVSIIAIRKLNLVDVNQKVYCVFEDSLTNQTAVNYYKNLLSCQYGVYIDDTNVATSVSDDDENPVVGTKIEKAQLLDTVYNQNEDFYDEERIEGSEYVTLYAPVELQSTGKKAMFFIGQSLSLVDIINKGIYERTVPAIVILCVLFVVVALILLMKFIMKPLSAAAKAIHSLAQDTGDADLTYRIRIDRNDEIGRLCNDVDIFLDRQQNLIIELKNAEKSLDEIGQNLALSSQESAGATSQIMTNIEGVRNQTELQTKSVDSANSEMNNTMHEVQQLDELIENQSAGITESSSSIEEMIANIESVTNAVQKMSEQFKQLLDVTQTGNVRQTEVNQKVQSMADQSKLLSDANTVISRIASQTNLLAMNAAIEAAHAGKAGAGFSVVADEIRKLAETSSAQSHAIGDELKHITQTMNDVVSSSVQSKEAFGLITEKLSDTNNMVEEINQAMTEQNNASKQTLESLKDINSSTAQVQTTAKSMKGGTENVQAELAKLTELAQSVSAKMDEMSAGATHITNAAQGVSDMAVQTRENISSMEKLVGRFKV